MASTRNMAKSGDVEVGNHGGRRLYPSMIENPDLRWTFIRKVYGILLIQLLLTIATATTVVVVTAIPKFILNTKAGLVIFAFTLIAPIIALVLLYFYRKNVVILALFTLCHCGCRGLVLFFFKSFCSCILLTGKVILLAGILTSVVVVFLTLYTFWAAKNGSDFDFMRPFLGTSLLVLIVFALIQIFIPFGYLGSTIFSGLSAIIFSGFLIYDTDNLIKRYDYDDYIWASVCLFLDIVNLFLAMVGLGGGGGGGGGD